MKFRIFFVCTLLIIDDPCRALPELKLSPPWIQTLQHVNENYSVKCEGDGEKVWKNPAGQVINSGNSVYTLKKSADNGLYLNFNKIQKEHKGIYNCTSNIRGVKYSIGFELVVIKPVSFANTTTEVTVSEGEDAVLDCFADGEPQPEISWLFKDELITDWSPSSNYRNTTRGLSLKISNVSWKNAGIYICRAFQKIMQTRHVEQAYQLRVQHKPYWPQTQTFVYGFRNESRNITCQVKAYPTAYFIWYRKNIPVDPKINHVRIVNEENISIMEVFLGDVNVLGEYDCEAANPMGILLQKMELKLMEKPQTPKLYVEGDKIQNTTVGVTIEPYPPREFIYIVYYTEYTYCSYEEKWKKAGQQICQGEKGKEDRISCTITNLSPFTKYVARAVLWNEGGSSSYSAELQFRTKKEFVFAGSNVTLCSNILLFLLFLIYTIIV